MKLGSATQPGRPVRAPTAVAKRPSHVMRRVRWATAMPNSTSETRPTPAVAPMTSSRAAPPAGGVLEARTAAAKVMATT